MRVSLLPQEIKAAKKTRSLKRWLVAVVLLVAVAVAAGVFAASQIADAANTRAMAASGEANLLQARLLKYASIQKLERQTVLAKAAARVGSSTQVDWRKLLGQVDDVKPDGFVITGVAIDSASPLADYTQGTSPLDAVRIGTVTITATTPSIEALPQWLAALPSVRGFADVVPTVQSNDSAYTVTVTMHISTAAYITPLKTGPAR